MLTRFAVSSALAAVTTLGGAAHAGPHGSACAKSFTRTTVHAETCHTPVRGDLHRVHHSPLLDYSLSSYDTPRYVQRGHVGQRVTRTTTTITKSGIAPSRFVDHDRRFGAAVRHASPYREVRREHVYVNHAPKSGFNLSISIGDGYRHYGHRYGGLAYPRAAHHGFKHHKVVKRHGYHRGHGYTPYRHSAKRYVHHPSRRSYVHHSRLQHAPRYVGRSTCGVRTHGAYARSDFRSGHRTIHHGSRRHR